MDKSLQAAKRRQRRKELYHTDPEVRRRQIKLSREAYRRKKATMIPVDRQVMTGPKGEELFTIGRISDLVGRKVETLRKYHIHGIFPDPTYHDQRGWRLYTRPQVFLMRRVFKQMDADKKMTLKDCKEIFHKEWNSNAEDNAERGND